MRDVGTRHAEVDALRQPFVSAVVLVLAVMVMTGGLIKVFGTGANRPEGAAERWLAAVGDTTRRGVGGDARQRAEELGPFELAEPLLPQVDTDGERAFPDLEVGQATGAGGQARVPFRLHQFAESGEGAEVTGSLVMTLAADEEWRVSGVDARRASEEVPSEGGEPPARATLAVWLGGAALAAALCWAASVAVRAAGR